MYDEEEVFNDIAEPEGKVGAKKLRKLQEKAEKKAMREVTENIMSYLPCYNSVVEYSVTENTVSLLQCYSSVVTYPCNVMSYFNRSVKFCTFI